MPHNLNQLVLIVVYVLSIGCYENATAFSFANSGHNNNNNNNINSNFSSMNAAAEGRRPESSPAITTTTTATTTASSRSAQNGSNSNSSSNRRSPIRRKQQQQQCRSRRTHLQAFQNAAAEIEDTVVNGENMNTSSGSGSGSSSGSISVNSQASGSLFWPSNKIRPASNGGRQQQQQQKHRDYYDEVFDAIVKIYATHNFEPDMTMPWQKAHSYTSYSSGFVIEGRRIVTNAHSVEYAGQVLVRRRGTSKKYRAKIEVVANECDLAVLTIADDSFWTTRTDYDEDDDDDDDDDGEDDHDEDDYDDGEDIGEDDDDGGDLEDDGEMEIEDYGDEDEDEDDELEDYDEEEMPSAPTTDIENGGSTGTADAILPLEFGDLPQLQDEVEVLGYPTGGDSLSVTKGVVSRIEATEYAQCSGSHLLAIQIDAAINGGNSGGPVVDATTGRVVGVAFQSLDEAENIGYVVPVTVVLHFLEDIRRHGKHSGVTCLGIRFSKLENESMRSYLKLPGGKTKKKGRGGGGDAAKGGIMVRGCYPTCPARDVLKEQDVILSVDGIPVASDGNVPFRRNGRERVSFSSYIQTKFADETVRLDVWRNGAPVSVDVPLCISKDLIPAHWDNRAPPYLIVAGLVFSVLSVPYLEACGAWGEYVSDNLSHLASKVNQPLEREDDEIVFLINVLAHPENTGYDGYCDMHLVSCNGTRVRSLRHLQELLTEQLERRNGEGGEEYIRLEFGSSSTGSGADSGGGTLVVLETNSIEEINDEVCEEHAIQNSFYFPPSRS